MVMRQLSPLEYAIYGVLCAAKHETGPEGARRLLRIEEALDEWDEEMMVEALKGLIDLGLVRQLGSILDMIHYEAIEAPLSSQYPGHSPGHK
jgi:hypothetical protein